MSVEQSGNGAVCEADDGDTAQCDPGDDLCPADSCVGAWSSCTVGCSKTYTVAQPASGGGAACPAADGAEQSCSPGEDSCPIPVVNCEGAWSGCDASCAATYFVTVEASGGGDTCPIPHGRARICAGGEGLCPPDIDCVGSWSSCDAECSKEYSVSVGKSGNGAACEADSGDTAQCAPGEDACPLGSCEGAWSICNANCTKTYDVTAEATGDGADCPADDGEEADCSPGEGSCPVPDIDCVGGFTGCDASCLTQTYSVTVEASGSGETCPIPAGRARSCAVSTCVIASESQTVFDAFSAFDKCSNETHLAALGQSRAECMAEELGWTTAQVIWAIVAFFAVVILLLLIVCFLLCKLEHHFCHPEHWLWDHSCGRCIHKLGGSVRFHPSEGWVGEQEKEDKGGAVGGKISGDVEGNGKDVAPPEKEEQEDEADEKKTEQQATSKAEPAASAAEVSRAPVHFAC